MQFRAQFGLNFDSQPARIYVYASRGSEEDTFRRRAAGDAARAGRNARQERRETMKRTLWLASCAVGMAAALLGQGRGAHMGGGRGGGFSREGPAAGGGFSAARERQGAQASWEAPSSMRESPAATYRRASQPRADRHGNAGEPSGRLRKCNRAPRYTTILHAHRDCLSCLTQDAAAGGTGGAIGAAAASARIPRRCMGQPGLHGAHRSL
jgi:hypothetical protein